MHDISTYQLAVIGLGAIAFGIYCLVKGGDWTVDSAAFVAEKSGLSKLFIAATIIAFGTSAPELFTSVNANLSGYPGISLGNVVGSNIANVLMVIGIAAIVAPIIVNRQEVLVDTAVMGLATVILAAGMMYGIFPRWAGAAMLVFLVAYIVYQWRANKLLEDDDDDEHLVAYTSTGQAWLVLFVGIATLVIGSEVLVQGAVAGGTALGVPEAVIGMTIVAFGTSLPELSVCVTAARRGHSDTIVGGIVGSNIFNILSIVAITSAVKPLVLTPSDWTLQLGIVIGVTVIFSVFLIAGRAMNRPVGIVFIVGYLAFIGFQYAAPALLGDDKDRKTAAGAAQVALLTGQR